MFDEPTVVWRHVADVGGGWVRGWQDEEAGVRALLARFSVRVPLTSPIARTSRPSRVTSTKVPAYGPAGQEGGPA